MSMFHVIIGLGAVGALIFFVGIAKGAASALRSGHDPDADSETGIVDSGHYGLTAALAVIASAVVIALAGVAPGLIYLGPLLAIVTAAGVGTAFLVEGRQSAQRR